MFHPVSSKVNFPQVEENILSLWRSSNVFERSVESRRGGRLFIFYEGPPTVNGSPGIHHVLARVFKDVIPRYRAMKGYYTPRQAGWDTHGLPIELEVERELGFSGKAQIEEYGIQQFNARCRESVFGYLKKWEAMTERIGFWVDLKHPYITMDNNYIETCWWAIKQMWDRGLVYQGYKVTPHCPRCSTSLSSHEVALGYQDDVEDPSVYVKFKVVPASVGSEARPQLFNLFLNKPAYFLAWTTTPWTLPGNTALAVAADADYAVVEVGDEYIIMADALLERVGLGGQEVVATLKGSDLAGGGGKRTLEYEPLFNPHEFDVERRRFVTYLGIDDVRKRSIELELQKPPPTSPLTGRSSLTYKVIATDFVSMEEGTGIVHVAPAFGEVDFEAGTLRGLDFVHPVDLQGNITGNYPFSGKFVKDADPLILDDLKSRGLLYRSEKIRHTYPFCWRCETPLLYYAKQTWYIKTTAVKENLIAGNNEINWYPEHIKYGRFGDWLENNVDWAFSRERYWGTPLNIWRCQACGSYDCIGSVKELEGKPGFSGLREPLDLHRPFVDELTFDCPDCGARMRRVPEVIDCWFDSGAMPIAQWHYPFDNDTLLEDGRFPADYICEAVDQTRGWFYSLHAISTLLFNRPCFKNVICLGHILDAKGEKMSKAKGNVVEPWAVINKYGADALRWYCLTASPPGNVRRFSEDKVAEVTRRFLLTLWNVYSFFVTYANIDHFTPDSETALPYESELDKWIISELNQLIVDVDSALDGYNPTEAGRKIEGFVDELSNWYVRRSRRRFWKSENDTDKLLAYTTLYQCLVTLSKLLAPFTPFLAEEMYHNLVCLAFPGAPDSVHLADFPLPDMNKIDNQLAADTQLVMKISSLGRAFRSKVGIRVRQPLDKAIVSVALDEERERLQKLKSQIAEELNVKHVTINVPTVKTDVSAPEVVILTKISPELKAEWMAREIVHRLQIMRRSARFDIADYITTYYQGDDYIRQVMTNKDLANYIKQETLSRQLEEAKIYCKDCGHILKAADVVCPNCGSKNRDIFSKDRGYVKEERAVVVKEIPVEGVFTESYKLGGYDILLGVRREE